MFKNTRVGHYECKLEGYEGLWADLILSVPLDFYRRLQATADEVARVKATEATQALDGIERLASLMVEIIAQWNFEDATSGEMDISLQNLVKVVPFELLGDMVVGYMALVNQPPLVVTPTATLPSG